ncbi:hypothetical protein COU89_02935 [Candidatus Roizmanbacteria bacterium CG10_big_fil_rev_8_21_14_0_10_45_7]|uniref:Uncharacterized protein n=1 Tax=Candidatus Roizmanbacteria bacterium CG10_big_fil_rev_8_21_14_0_10_45_7 TaxID=1974854 RepID=A0A2M8KUC6_9BACT|nr:MAG: hypothetical protein COU89_02935 [Candidatus Roizmanbacteria bacterium CG10_big_fil_rev_8_21_14_0_10_45_7]
MATQSRKSPRKTSNQTPWGWIAAVVILAVLLFASWANSITRVDVGTVQGDLAAMQAQLTAQAMVTDASQATEPPAATEAPAEATEAPVATEAPTEAPTQTEPADRIARLIELDKVYRAQGWMAWLKSAGVTCDAAVEARQPEEETVTDANGAHVVVSGIQVKGNCTIPWPAVVTTDRPNEVETSADSRTYQPDLKNPSVMYTNAKLKGQGTIWVDSSNWGQLDPTK